MCYVVGGECQKCVEGQTGAGGGGGGGVVVKNMWYSIILKNFLWSNTQPTNMVCVRARASCLHLKVEL